MNIDTNNVVVLARHSKIPSFLRKGTTQEDLERLKKNDNFVVFEVGDKVTFQGHAHLEDDGKSKLKTGVIKKLGYVPGYVNPQIVCGIKVEGEKFGSALPYNYTMHPISLTKIV